MGAIFSSVRIAAQILTPSKMSALLRSMWLLRCPGHAGHCPSQRGLWLPPLRMLIHTVFDCDLGEFCYYPLQMFGQLYLVLI